MDFGINSDEGAVQMPDLPRLCHTIFDSSPLPMAVVEGDKHVLRCVNRAFCRLHGISREQLIGKLFGEILPKDGSLSSLDRVYRTGGAETHAAPEHSESKTAFWSYAMWPVLGGDERPWGVMIQVTETARFHQQATSMNQELLLSALRQHELIETAEKLNAQLQREMAERKWLEQALLNSEKLSATARLASTMSHEINNPLSAITNLIYLLAPLQTSPEAQAYIATLGDQVKRLSRIATQMLKFHRDNNLPTEFKLEELLRETGEFYRHQAEKQGIVVIQRLETEGSSWAIAVKSFRSLPISCSMRWRLHLPAGRSLYIYILRLLGFVRLTTDVVTAFLSRIRASESIPSTMRGSLSLFSPRKGTKEQGWGCGSAQVLSIGSVARFASGVHAAQVEYAPVSRFSCLPKKVLSHRIGADTSGTIRHVRRSRAHSMLTRPLVSAAGTTDY